MFEDSKLEATRAALEWSRSIESIKSELKMIKIERTLNLCPSTHKRLLILEKAKSQYLQQLLDICSSLKTVTVSAPQLEALGIARPDSHGLMTYAANASRDWAVWGEHEIDQSLALLKQVCLPLKGRSIDAALTLGAGAGRVPLELHHRLGFRHHVMLDINPMLLWVSQKMLRNEPIDWIEFPRLPIEVDDVALTCRLERRGLAGSVDPSQVSLVCGDAAQVPVANGSCDLLFTPWIVDLLPYDLASIAGSLNAPLKMGGHWVFFGPLGFLFGALSKQHTGQELIEVVEGAGFKLVSQARKAIPYMQMPGDASHRIETVQAFLFEKVAKVAPVKLQALGFEPWLQDTHLPVPPHQIWTDLFQMHSVYLTVLGFVDGRRSIQEIAKLASPNLGLDPADAVASIRNFLSKVYGGRSRLRFA
jgi:hypothetical protein